jgi:phosphoadenosine phosphosulfate reductase
LQLNFEGETKDEVAIERIKMHYNPSSPLHVAFSGGKDSVVIYDIAKRSELPFVAEYKVTGIDPYQLVKFIKTEYPEVRRIRPEKTIWELMQKKGMPPFRQRRYCCEYLKEHNPDNSTVITGVRSQESVRRRHRGIYEVCHKNGTVKYLHPIMDWTETEVWLYIKEHNLPYCELYDMGFKRLGCVLCPMGTVGIRRYEMSLFPEITSRWKLGFKKLWDNGKVKGHDSSEDYFEWWISQKGMVSDAQCTMFHD